jgi:hypothetical protein
VSTASFLSSRLEGYVEHSADGRYWHQMAPVTFRSARVYVVNGRLTREFTVPASPAEPFACDLESWELAEWQETGLAGVLHDWLYRTGLVSRADADALYHEALTVLGTKLLPELPLEARRWDRVKLAARRARWRAVCFVRWSGVRMFATRAWRGHRAVDAAKSLGAIALGLVLLGQALWLAFLGLLVAVRWPL